MPFWSRKEKRNATSGLAVPAGWMLDAMGSGPSKSGQRVTIKNALGLAPVWGAVSMISEQVGQLPLKVYRQIDGDRVEAREHRAWSMLHDKPNDHTPADRFWSTATTQLLLYGNAFVRKHRNLMGLVDELTLLNPAHMMVYWDGDQRIKNFKYTPPNGQLQEYGPDEILHIFGLSLDGVIGESVIGYCKNAFGAAIARDAFEGAFYRNGAVFSAAIEHPGELSDTAVRHLSETAKILYGGADRAHQMPVMEEGAQLKVMSSPLRDLMFVESQQLSRTDIAVMFKLPPNYLGGSSGDSLTYATVESNQIQFALHAIAPWTNVIASALNSDSGIFPQNIFDAEFVLDGMLRADAAARGAYYKDMAGVGAITPNEIRRLENLPPIPGGDKPVAPTQERVTATEQIGPGQPVPKINPNNLPKNGTPALPAPMPAKNGQGA